MSAPGRDSGAHTADELRSLARDVRRIGDGFRDNPEAIAIAKDDVVHRLVALARRVERQP